MNNSLLGSYSFATPQPGSEHRDAIEGVIKNFVSAWNHDDADALVSLFLPDGEMKSPSQEAATSRAGIRELVTQERRELFKDSTLNKHIRKIQFSGPDQATVEGTYELSGVEPGLGFVEVSIKGNYTFYLEKQDGTWLIKKCDIRKSEEGQ